jgi:hypothetical protein
MAVIGRGRAELAEVARRFSCARRVAGKLATFLAGHLAELRDVVGEALARGPSPDRAVGGTTRPASRSRGSPVVMRAVERALGGGDDLDPNRSNSARGRKASVFSAASIVSK